MGERTPPSDGPAHGMVRGRHCAKEALMWIWLPVLIGDAIIRKRVWKPRK